MTATTPQPLVEKEEQVPRALTIFISYGTPDQYFAPLLKNLLEVHGHSVYVAPEDIPAGAPLPEEIEAKLRSSDALIVLVSPGAVASRWVPEELTIFEAVNSDAKVIPLVLETTDLEQVCPALARHRAVFMRPCMRDGLRALFRSLGNDFLSANELGNRRSGGDLRAGTHARSGADRRTAPIRGRLHVGFQATYARDAGRDVCATTDLSPESVTELVAAFEPEARRYEFRDGRTGRLVPAVEALTAAMPAVCEAFRIASPPAVMAVCDVLAGTLTSMFDVSMIERRGGRRRAGQERAHGDA